MPVVRRHLGDGIIKLLPIRVVGEISTVYAATNVWLIGVDAATGRSSKRAIVVRFEPCEVDGKDVMRICRVGELEPFAWKIRRDLAPCADRCGCWGGGWKAEIDSTWGRSIRRAIHT